MYPLHPYFIFVYLVEMGSYSARFKEGILQDSKRANLLLAATMESCGNYGGKVSTNMAMCKAKTIFVAMEIIISLLSETLAKTRQL